MGMIDWLLIKIFINDLKSKNYDAKTRALRALRTVRDERITEIMIQLLNDDSVTIRGDAASALGNIGDEKVVEPLALVLEKDDFSTVRERAVDAIVKVGDKKVVDIVIKALHDNDVSVRAKAADYLGKMGDKRAIEPLINLLNVSNIIRNKYYMPLGGGFPIPYFETNHRIINQVYVNIYDENEGARIKAADALGNIGGEDAIEALVNVLIHERREGVDQKNRHIVDAVERALTKLGHIVEKERLEKVDDSSKLDIKNYGGKYIYDEENLEKLKAHNQRNWGIAQRSIERRKSSLESKKIKNSEM